MTELKAISSQHAKFTREISNLRNRIDKIEDVVDKLSHILKELKDGISTELKLSNNVVYKYSDPKTENIEKKIKMKTLRYEAHLLKSPFTSTGPIPRPARETERLGRSGPYIIIVWLWKYWSELVAEFDLDPETLDEIQSAIVQEETYYQLWPQRVFHLFQGDFRQVNTFCKTLRPTWPMTIEAVLQILALSNHLRTPINVFVDF
ncbi:hypothetical protein OnM2_106030 [Erysiphe neolycopersici]|uniref:Uncharacterized protein n=1 Tax=Erysiphe neolycopersici TaxID=212602 RepID=A0A420H7D4_9PEZI|nr:hypothetical protein OnM2_106030 [Erysiphe neolycopersici]